MIPSSMFTYFMVELVICSIPKMTLVDWSSSHEISLPHRQVSLGRKYVGLKLKTNKPDSNTF